MAFTAIEFILCFYPFSFSIGFDTQHSQGQLRVAIKQTNAFSDNQI